MGAITNWGAAIWNSLAAALGMVFAFIPRLLGFAIILLVGWLIAKAVERGVVYLLHRIGMERMSERIGLHKMQQSTGFRLDTSMLLGKIAYWFILLIFLVPALNSLGLDTVSTLMQSIIGYIPNVFVAVLVLFLGTLFATFIAEIVQRVMSGTNIGNPKIFANIARFSIIAFAALVALEQLQIAPALLNILFTAIMGGVALAFGLAFGLGGRDSAQRLLNRGEAELSNARMTDPNLQAQPKSRTPQKPPQPTT